MYVAVDYALANSILLEGPEGLVIVDTTESQVAAKDILVAFRRISSKPIKAIIAITISVSFPVIFKM